MMRKSPNETHYLTLNAPAGLTPKLTQTRLADGVVIQAASSTGIVESPAGHYVATRTEPSTPGDYIWTWTITGSSRSSSLLVQVSTVAGSPQVGPAGPQGPAGVKGDTGTTGAKGDTGASGSMSNLLFDEPFTSSAANFTADLEFSGSYTVTGGALVFTNASDAIIYRTSGAAADHKSILKFTPGASGAADPGVTFKRLDGNNHLLAVIIGSVGSSGTFAIYKKDANVYTSLASSSVGAFTASTPIWIVTRVVGNFVKTEMWSVDPASARAIDSGAQPTSILTHILAGGNATKFGSGISGGFGIRTSNPGTGKFNDFIVATPNTPAREAF